jgi:hypothetical protein
LANWFSTLCSAAETHLPNTVKLNPLSTEGLIFLLTTGMMGRLMVGTTRTIADAPPINPNDDQSPQQKTNIQLERVFMEFVGVPINFLVLKFCEDVGEYASFAVDRKLLPKLGSAVGNPNWGNSINPGHWLEKLESLTDDEKKVVARGLVYTFNPQYRKTVLELKKQNMMKRIDTVLVFNEKLPCFENLAHLSADQCKQLLVDDLHSLSKNFNDGAKYSTFLEGLAKLAQDPVTTPGFSMERFQNSVGKGFLEKRFAKNNLKTNLFLLGAGTIGSTIFSGVIWQALNDSVIRKKLVPLISDSVTRLYYGENYQKEWETQQALLFPDEQNKPHCSASQPYLCVDKPCYSYSKNALASTFSPSAFYSNSVLNFKP